MFQYVGEDKVKEAEAFELKKKEEQEEQEIADRQIQKDLDKNSSHSQKEAS